MEVQALQAVDGIHGNFVHATPTADRPFELADTHLIDWYMNTF